MKTADQDPNTLEIPDESGEVPKSRIRNVWQAWSVCDELEQQDIGRAKKRGRIFRAYALFPPSEYSKLFEVDLDWQSNVPFGMLRYRVNNALGSFIDMVTERSRTMEIRTKYGTPKEQSVYSDLISDAFEKVLDNWDERLMNVEQCVLDMLLYSKGVEMAEDKEGCTTEHVPVDDLLVPDGTKVSMANFDLCAIKKRYTLHELWEKIENGGGDNGWNKAAILDAMRWQRDDWSKMTSEEWTKQVAEGNFFLGSHLREHVDCYILFVREFRDKKVSKFVILRNYGAAIKNQMDKFKPSTDKDKEKVTRDAVNKDGFLFFDIDFVDDIRDVFSVFMDSAGSGRWHNIPSLAESVFIQCRQYDFTMNAVMDAIKINMMLILQGSTPEAGERLKEMMFGPSMIFPSDIPFVQQRVQLPTNEAVQTMQFIMLDMFQGIGEYRVQERAKGGEAQTATQANIDAATTAKLSGTQLKRFAMQEKFYYRSFYKRLVNMKDGEKDYELCQIFKDELARTKVPKEAWKWENIDSFHANVLAGAGSPAYKLNAAMKTIELLNISPKSEGQSNAIKDGLAVLQGRKQVDRYYQDVMPDKNYNERLAGYENAMFSSMTLNPKDVQVNPDDEDMYHLNVHISDMERTMEFVNEKLKDGSLTQVMAESAGMKLVNEVGHISAHIEQMSRDHGKEDDVNLVSKKMAEMQGAMDQMAKQVAKFLEQKQQQPDPSQDPEVQRRVALSQLELDHEKRHGDMKLANASAQHQQKLKYNEELAAQEIAILRSKNGETATQ